MVTIEDMNRKSQNIITILHFIVWHCKCLETFLYYHFYLVLYFSTINIINKGQEHKEKCNIILIYPDIFVCAFMCATCVYTFFSVAFPPLKFVEIIKMAERVKQLEEEKESVVRLVFLCTVVNIVIRFMLRNFKTDRYVNICLLSDLIA